MKLGIVSDTHYGAGFDLGRKPWDRLEDQDLAGARIADAFLSAGVEAVLFGGDIGERRKPYPRENVAIAAFFRRFGPVPVLAIPGNHDIGEVDGPCSLDVFAPEFIQLERHPRVVNVGGAAVACLPRVPLAYLIARMSGGGERADINRLASALLIETARELRAECSGKYPDVPCILLGHWAVEGTTLPTGLAVDQLPEPILPLGELEALGFDLVVMGHVHQAQAETAVEGGWAFTKATAGERLGLMGIKTLSGRGPIVIPGSPMPLNFGEASTDHGVWVYDTDSRELTFIPIESRPLVGLEVDLRDASDPMAALLEAIA